MKVAAEASRATDGSTIFTFPLKIKTSMKFDSLEELLTIVNSELQSIGQPMNMLKKTFTPRRADWRWLCLKCQYCTGSINVIHQRTHILVTSVNSRHEHLEGQQKIYGKKSESSRRPKQLIVQEPPKEQSNDSIQAPQQPANEIADQRSEETSANKPCRSKKPMCEQVPHIRNIFQQEAVEKVQAQDNEFEQPLAQSISIELERSFSNISAFGSLKKQFQANDMTARIGWNNEPQSLFPKVMVLATKCMVNNYHKYGDLVCFTVMQGLLKNITHDAQQYRVGIFSVLDNNTRLLLAGVVLFAGDSSSKIRQAFKVLFHDKAPQSVLTNDTPLIRRSMEKLMKEGWFKGHHLLSPSEALNEISQEIPGSNAHKMKTIVLLQAILTTRTKQNYEKGLQELKKLDSYKVVEELLVTKPSIFYQQTGKSFVSINSNGCERTIQLMRQNFSSRMHIPEFVQALFHLDHRLTEESNNVYERYSADLPIFLDKRFEELLGCCERVVVERFIENYLNGIMNYTVLKQYSDRNAKSCIVKNTVTGSHSEIYDWCCECAEFEKTGIACAHIIMIATVEGSKPYTDLISARWKKPTLTADQ